MKILKVGVIPVKKYRGKCINCNCEIEAELSDHNDKKYPVSSRCRLIGVNCPTDGCGYMITCRKLRP